MLRALWELGLLFWELGLLFCGDIRLGLSELPLPVELPRLCCTCTSTRRYAVDCGWCAAATTGRGAVAGATSVDSQ